MGCTMLGRSSRSDWITSSARWVVGTRWNSDVCGLSSTVRGRGSQLDKYLKKPATSGNQQTLLRRGAITSATASMVAAEDTKTAVGIAAAKLSGDFSGGDGALAAGSAVAQAVADRLQGIGGQGEAELDDELASVSPQHDGAGAAESTGAEASATVKSQPAGGAPRRIRRPVLQASETNTPPPAHPAGPAADGNGNTGGGTAS